MASTQETQTNMYDDESLNEELEAINYVDEIETVIASMAAEQKYMTGQSDSGDHAWKFKYGTVEVYVRLTGETEQDVLSVWSPVLTLPANKEAELFRRLLTLNWSSTLEACYALFDNQIVVLSSRTVADLNPGEISRAITIVATIADDMDEPLQEEFGKA